MENTLTLAAWSSRVVSSGGRRVTSGFKLKHHHILNGFTSTTPTIITISRNNKLMDGACGRLVSKMAEHEGKAADDVISGDMIFEAILEDGVFRFDCCKHDRDAAYPSLSFVNSKDRDTLIINHNNNNNLPLYTPTFECQLGNQIVKLELPDGTSFYGTGEVSGQLERTGKRVFTWNTDAWGYGVGTTSLYQSHPWVLAVLPNGEALGILADTTRRCEIDLRKESTIRFSAPSPYPVITFGPFSSPIAVLISLSHAIDDNELNCGHDVNTGHDTMGFLLIKTEISRYIIVEGGICCSAPYNPFGVLLSPFGLDDVYHSDFEMKAPFSRT